MSLLGSRAESFPLLEEDNDSYQCVGNPAGMKTAENTSNGTESWNLKRPGQNPEAPAPGLHAGDRRANQGFGQLQPGLRPELEIVHI